MRKISRFQDWRGWRIPSPRYSMQSNVPDAQKHFTVGPPFRFYCSYPEDLAGHISGLCGKHKAVEAFKILSMMNVKNSRCKLDIYIKVLDSLVFSGNMTEAFQLFEQLKEEFPSNQSLYISMFRSLCKAGHIDDACQHVDSMSRLGRAPDTSVVNELVSEFCKAGRWKTCHEFLSKLCDLGHIPPLVTFNLFFGGLCRAGLMPQACKLLDDVTKLGFSLSVYTYSIMINTLCKADKVNEAYRLLKAMRNKNCEPDVVCFSTVLHGYVRLGKHELALKIMDEMRRTACLPDVVTFNSLISMFSKLGDTDKAYEVWGEMKASGCVPDHISYTSMLDGLCRRKKTKECLRLLKEMLRKRHMPGAPLQRKLRECFERNRMDSEMQMDLQEIKKFGVDLRVCGAKQQVGTCVDG